MIGIFREPRDCTGRVNEELAGRCFGNNKVLNSNIRDVTIMAEEASNLASVAQKEERQFRKLRVRGSMPRGGSNGRKRQNRHASASCR